MADLRRTTARSGILVLLMALGACTHRVPAAKPTPTPTPTVTAAPTQTASPTATASPPVPAPAPSPTPKPTRATPASPSTPPRTPGKTSLDHIAVIVMENHD